MLKEVLFYDGTLTILIVIDAGDSDSPNPKQPSNTPKIPWKSSKAKVLLREGLTTGDPSTHPFWVKTPAEVWASNTLFREYPKTNFCNNLRTYKKLIRLQMESISFEDEATRQHNMLFRPHPRPKTNNCGNPRIHNHPGKSWLELDVAAGNATGRTPAQLKQDRPEYAEFETKQFCKAVNNERQKQRTEKFWAPKRNQEGALRNIKRREEQLEELGMTKK